MLIVNPAPLRSTDWAQVIEFNRRSSKSFRETEALVNLRSSPFTSVPTGFQLSGVLQRELTPPYFQVRVAPLTDVMARKHPSVNKAIFFMG